MSAQPTPVDQTMLQAFDILQRAYTTIVSELQPPTSPSVEACDFLAAHTIWFGSGALKLATQGIIPPAAALTRTCIEAAACSRYLFSLSSMDRDKEAGEFLEFRAVCRAEYAERYHTGNDPRIVAVRNGLDAEGRAKLGQVAKARPGESWRKRFRELKRKWNFDALVKAEAMQKPIPGLSSLGFDRLVVNEYDSYSYFVHPNPVVTVFAPHIQPAHICQTVMLSTINSVGVLLQVSGKNNQDFLKAGQAFITKYEKIQQ